MGVRLLPQIHSSKPGFTILIFAAAASFSTALYAAPAGVTFSQSTQQIDRYDFVEITAAAHSSGLYTNLITSAVGINASRIEKLVEAGLDHVQISIQDSEAASADHIANYPGAFARKRALANKLAELKIPLTLNCVVHRANIDRIAAMVELAPSVVFLGKMP